MDIEAQQQKRRDNILSSLNATIEALNLVGGLSDIIPAKAVFGTVSVILTMIRVSLPLVYVDRLRTETRPGFDDQPGGLRRTWVGLRRHLYHPRQRVEGEKIGRPQQPCVGGNRAAEDVSYIGAHCECHTDDAFGLIPGPSRRSSRRSSGGVNGTQSLEFSTQRTIRRRSSPGERTSIGSFSCSTWVASLLVRLLLNVHH